MIWSYWCQRYKRYTWTALQHVTIAKRKSHIINKISNHPKNSPSFYLFLWSGQIFCRNGNFKIWPWEIMTKVTSKVNGQGHIWNKPSNVFTLLLFRANRTMHFLRHRQFIIWPWNFEVKLNAEFKEFLSVNLVAILVVIVAQTHSRYGINKCIGIYFFYFRLNFNLQITMKHSDQ